MYRFVWSVWLVSVVGAIVAAPHAVASESTRGALTGVDAFDVRVDMGAGLDVLEFDPAAAAEAVRRRLETLRIPIEDSAEGGSVLRFALDGRATNGSEWTVTLRVAVRRPVKVEGATAWIDAWSFSTRREKYKPTKDALSLLIRGHAEYNEDLWLRCHPEHELPGEVEEAEAEWATLERALLAPSKSWLDTTDRTLPQLTRFTLRFPAHSQAILAHRQRMQFLSRLSSQELAREVADDAFVQAHRHLAAQARVRVLGFDYRRPSAAAAVRLFERVLETNADPNSKAMAHLILFRLHGTEDDVKDPVKAERHLEALTEEHAGTRFYTSTYAELARAFHEPYPESSLVVGAQAPELQGTTHDGRPARLADHLGKVVVLDFWGHW